MMRMSINGTVPRFMSVIQHNIGYQFPLWLNSKWQRETRFYTLSLCQDVFGNWLVVKTWGSAIKRGFGQTQDLSCSDYESALSLYQRLYRRRQQRGYQRVDLTILF